MQGPAERWRMLGLRALIGRATGAGRGRPDRRWAVEVGAIVSGGRAGSRAFHCVQFAAKSVDGRCLRAHRIVKASGMAGMGARGGVRRPLIQSRTVPGVTSSHRAMADARDCWGIGRLL